MMRLYLLVPLVSGSRIDFHAVSKHTEQSVARVSEEHVAEADVESEWMTCPTGRVKAAFGRGCATVLSDNGRGRCRLQFDDGRTDEMHAMHLERHASCPQFQSGFVGQQGHGIYNPGFTGQYGGGGGFVGQQGHGIYNPNGFVGQQGHGIYNPGLTGQYSSRRIGVYLSKHAAGDSTRRSLNEALAVCDQLGGACAGVTCRTDFSCTVREGQTEHPSPSGEYSFVKRFGGGGGFVGQQGHGIYNPNGFVGQQGHGIYDPNGFVGQQGQGTYNPNGFVGQQGHGIYNPNGINPIGNPNGFAGQNGQGAYNPNGFVGQAPGQNGGGIYNPNGAGPAPGQNGGGIYNPNGFVGQAPGQNGGGIYNPNGVGPAPGQNGGGIYNPNGFAAQQQPVAQQYSCPLLDSFLAGYAAGDRQVRSQDQAQQRCDELGVSCAGITCRADARCTVRAGGTVNPSSSGEYSLKKGAPEQGCDLQGNNPSANLGADDLWPQHGADDTRCTRGATSIVRNRLECQQTAMRQQHAFYHFREDNKKCGTAETCDSPITGTTRPWRVYTQPVLITGATSDELWPQHGTANTRCSRGDVSVVADRLECQQVAMRQQHAFYHFREDNNQCGTAETCDSPMTETRRPWRVYAQPVLGFQGSR